MFSEPSCNGVMSSEATMGGFWRSGLTAASQGNDSTGDVRVDHSSSVNSGGRS